MAVSRRPGILSYTFRTDPKQTFAIGIRVCAKLKSGNWKDIAELLGMAAIIGSLVFVGLELRQSHEIALADQYQRRADASADNWALFLETDRALIEIIAPLEAMAKAGQLPASLTEYGNKNGFDALATGYALHMVSFTNWDSVYFQYQRGFLAEEAWASQRRRLKAALANPRFADMYRTRSWIWRQSFQDLCDELLKEIESQR